MPIVVENLTHIYSPGTPFEVVALKDVSIKIEEGEFIGLIGHTGSGKSTLIQHLNGLLKPTSGKVKVDNLDLTEKTTKLKDIRRKVGLVFQYPESQLFEETVELDIAFGPKNLGYNEKQVLKKVKKSLEWVNLNYDEVKDRSPFELSGGQMRKVAIAGVLAMEPKYLILDEPTAGLDPRSRDDMLGKLKKLHQELKITIILVSHSMDEIAELVDRIIVMDGGKVFADGKPEEVFAKRDDLIRIGLEVPPVTQLILKLKELNLPVNPRVYKRSEAKEELKKILGGWNHVTT
ncbi:energy-coupling factor transport system ATP-binding protein [Anaerobranca californiensis DSM 14826]|jgi:energy-coupling factor transport system ATP-binding protein|uniref:Energy-coupling factor transporter ATP-binding protein EcfA2 n=1 Tax=Anaerobranca californiensis DSM 14826 TaxID=1120989 RepID=A0A1M6MZ04_9FIRM|nr:energy-coupling factor transporter ATPase [Anaerobranca californiensis]SHJ88678.1 energy-coupling factor transport system ATP-binding protein [Anaerobranca californiensis DSM 14826]